MSSLITECKLRLTVERKSAPVLHIYFKNILMLTFQIPVFCDATIADKFMTNVSQNLQRCRLVLQSTNLKILSLMRTNVGENYFNQTGSF